MDKKIWQNIPEGDHVAYEQLYFDYFKKFYNYGKKFTNDVPLIEDSIQEVFLEIWSKRERILEIDSPNSYFFSAFRFILLGKIKQSKKDTWADLTGDEIDFSIEQKIIAQETNSTLQQKIATALQTLTPRQKEAIFLRFYEGLCYEEVASVLHISIKATYKIMARSLASLKDQIDTFLVILFVLISLFIY